MFEINHLLPRKSGFTLIELVVVIAILAILMAIIIIGVIGYINEAKAAADRESLHVLNVATQLYGTKNVIEQNDIFAGLSTDTDRMNALISADYLQALVSPQTADKQFRWQIAAQLWTIENTNTVIMGNVITMGNGGQKGYIKGVYSGTATDIVLPNKIDGTVVTHIYQDVFNGKALTSISFESNSTIVQIHARAFNNNQLTEITLPNSLQRIDYAAFNNNPITKITIGSGVLIESKAFQNNDSFKTVYTASGAGTYLFIGGQWVKQ